MLVTSSPRRRGPRQAEKLSIVITGLVPVIHAFSKMGHQDVDGRVKPGHDDGDIGPIGDDDEHRIAV